jgi:hypothetical protein
MIRNIPNKYTQAMLLETFDRTHAQKYDFFYLPIDFKNKCNMGYAFINFIHSVYIVDFFLQFDSKKWEVFNSDKICKITYGRIQGKAALENNFANMNVTNFPLENTGKGSVKVRPLICDLSVPSSPVIDKYRMTLKDKLKSIDEAKAQEELNAAVQANVPSQGNKKE